MLRQDSLRDFRLNYNIDFCLAPRVRLVGLRGHVELNGREGFQGRWINEAGRYQVY